MDKKDEIILQQLDVIRTMTQNNLNRMGSDFWGAPLTPDAPKSAVPKEVAPKANAPKSGTAQSRTSPQPPSVRARKKRKKRRFPHPRRSRTSKKSLTPTSALARSSAR